MIIVHTWDLGYLTWTVGVGECFQVEFLMYENEGGVSSSLLSKIYLNVIYTKRKRD